ncbi:ABC transporter permease subunit [Bacillus hwajinpoensis]|uniref:ABC transporter permease subunit n=1 Tax=Guptibacillus hwajinpoensis TaxID=208199 RepID=A0A845F456_9BACL|nr:ABC transporter permease subunit [Pseudalkalibacillus hwajinpoensis]MYL65580.1 ABC transporter permease subunit [Pseudalkalibacillus hwajinpoensis]
MGNMVRIGSQFIAAFLGVLLLGAIPGMFNGMKLDPGGYMKRLQRTIEELIHFQQLTFRSGNESYQLFPLIYEYLFYSIIILFSALILAFFVAFLFTYVTYISPSFIQKWFKRVAFLTESFPDVFILAIVQIGVIWVYKKTEVLLMDVAAYERIYTMPILILSILPTFLLYRIMIHVLDEEVDKPYVELARTKGLEPTKIFLVHIFRNTLLSTYFHSKSIVWFTLSNLFIMEYVFNLNGLIRFMYEHPTPEIFTVSALLLFIPIFLFLTVYQLVAERTAQEEALM